MAQKVLIMGESGTGKSTSLVICGIYVVATCDLKGTQNIAMAIFTAIVQGILVAGLSNYVNQVFKQLNKAE